MRRSANDRRGRVDRLSKTLISPLFSATKTRPSGANWTPSEGQATEDGGLGEAARQRRARRARRDGRGASATTSMPVASGGPNSSTCQLPYTITTVRNRGAASIHATNGILSPRWLGELREGCHETEADAAAVRGGGRRDTGGGVRDRSAARRPGRRAGGLRGAGLSAPVEILVDRWGVPHIYAGSERRRVLAQGFNAARDRLWQIDLWRRRGLGRLSAAFGRAYVEQDRAARLFLYRGDMRPRVAGLRRRTRSGSPTAFAAGVNAYVDLAERGAELLPVEFGALRLPARALGGRGRGAHPQPRPRLASRRPRSPARSVLREFGRKAERAAQAARAALALEVPDGLDLADIPDDVLDVYELATRPSSSPSAARQRGSAPDACGRAATTG